MKFFVFLSLLSFSIVNTYASLPQVIQCLAKEEEHFHAEKYTGPEYHLNQQVLNYLTIENKIMFTNKFQDSICKSNFKAWTFVSKILTDQSSSIAHLNNVNDDQEVLEYAKKVRNLTEKAYEIFLNYVSLVQVHLKDPYCLKKILPNYENYLEREKYLKGREIQYNNDRSLLTIKNLLNLIKAPGELKERCNRSMSKY